MGKGMQPALGLHAGEEVEVVGGEAKERVA
jgi:hypothetical protein